MNAHLSPPSQTDHESNCPIQIDEALAILDNRWSSTTQFLHGQNELFSTISFEDNALFALLLMRSHRLWQVLKARDLLLRLLCWQIPTGCSSGLFPRYLHKFPVPGSSGWQKWLVGILTLILKTQGATCGAKLLKLIDISLQRLLKAIETCQKNRCGFEDGVLYLALNWLQSSRYSSDRFTAVPAFYPNWILGPQKLALLTCLASEFGNWNSCFSQSLPHWHGPSGQWFGLLHRRLNGSDGPLDLISAFFEPQLIDKSQRDAGDLNRLCLLRAIVPKDLRSTLKKLQSNLSKTQFQPIAHGQGATFVTTSRWAGTCLKQPIRPDGVDATKHWDLARFVWGQGQQNGSCRLKIDADLWIETPQFSSDGQNGQVHAVFLTKVSPNVNQSPLTLICKKQKRDSWTVRGARTSIFRSEDELEYRNESIQLMLKIATETPHHKWIGHIQPFQLVKRVGDADHWKIWIKPFSPFAIWQIKLIFEIKSIN